MRTKTKTATIDANNPRGDTALMRVAFIGYRGSGKTSIGRELASRAGVEFVDADDELIRRAGRSIKEIFETDGEAAFRDLETTVLADLLQRPEGVLSLGGGVILRPANRELLQKWNRPRVYLHADAETLYHRIHADPNTAANRPALTHLGGGVEEIGSLLAIREPLYRAVKTHEVDVSTLSLDEAVKAVEQILTLP